MAAKKNFTDRIVTGVTKLCSMIWAELLYHSMIMADLILLPLDSVPHGSLCSKCFGVVCRSLFPVPYVTSDEFSLYVVEA
jgi:hypothetical protein